MPPHPPHAWLVGSGCEVQLAPANGLYLAGACVRRLTRTCQRDRPRWYHSTPIVGMDCRLYLAGSAACLAGSSRGPSCRIAESAGARSKPHVPTCYTSLVHGSEAAAKHQNLIKLHNSNRPDLPHHPGSAAGYILRGHPWRKGWPLFLALFAGHVAIHEHESHSSSIEECGIIGIRVSLDPQLAVLAHACTLLGLSVGSADRPNVLPTHRFFSRSVTWRRTGGVL